MSFYKWNGSVKLKTFSQKNLCGLCVQSGFLKTNNYLRKTINHLKYFIILKKKFIMFPTCEKFPASIRV